MAPFPDSIDRTAFPDSIDPRAWTDAFMSGPGRRATFADIDAYLAFIADVRVWMTAALDQPSEQPCDPSRFRPSYREGFSIHQHGARSHAE